MIDVFPAESEKNAIRIELFDEEIEALYEFDPLTGHVIRKIPRFTIYPKSHYVTKRGTLLRAIDTIKIELKQRLDELKNRDKLVEFQRLEQRTKFDLEMMTEIGYCSGVENYSRHLSGRQPGEAPATLIEYLPKNSLLVIDESHVTIPQLGAMYKGDRSRKESLVNYGFRLPSALDNRPLKFEEFEKFAPQMIFVSATPSTYEKEHAGQVVELVVRPTGLVDPPIEIRPAGSQVDDLLSEINKCVAREERVLVTTLTKRMSEDLTEYMSEHGVRVRYLHSDIGTVERTEILRDLRLGEFDVLVGINLLREGLDLPEVSLVAILDADKEGFLRSDRSLIQTVGRAARHVEGRAILYADKITGSMKRAMDEMERRREVQLAYNKEHGVTPRGIAKPVSDIMESGYSGDTTKNELDKSRKEREAAYAGLTQLEILKKVDALEIIMHEHARDLEFEEAGRIRDEIESIKAEYLAIPSRIIVTGQAPKR